MFLGNRKVFIADASQISEIVPHFTLRVLLSFRYLWPAVPCDLVDPPSGTSVLTDGMSEGTDTDRGRVGCGSRFLVCVRLLPLGEAAQAIYIGKKCTAID